MVVIFYGPLAASNLFVLAATMDRFIAVKFALRYHQFVTTRGVRICAAVMWFWAFSGPVAWSIMTAATHSLPITIDVPHYELLEMQKSLDILASIVMHTSLVAAVTVIITNICILVIAWLLTRKTARVQSKLIHDTTWYDMN